MGIVIVYPQLSSLFSFEGQLWACSWVLSLLDRYFYNMYIVECLNLCFALMARNIVYFHVYIILDFPITYRHVPVLCQSECECLHKTVNMVVFFVKTNENTYTKGRALMRMYRVNPITKIESLRFELILGFFSTLIIWLIRCFENNYQWRWWLFCISCLFAFAKEMC